MPHSTAASLGSAMVMLPRNIAIGRTGRVPKHLHENIREICNLFCLMLGEGKTMKLAKVDFQSNYVPFSALLGNLSGSRIDVSVEINGHRPGPMTLIKYGRS